jgi:hypothetical protein
MRGLSLIEESLAVAGGLRHLGLGDPHHPAKPRPKTTIGALAL